jgi:hypothetical protein
MKIQGVESFLPPDPRLDHDLIRALVLCDTLGPMPPLDELRAPQLLCMRNWGKMRAEWHDAVSRSLTLLAPEADKVLELDRYKKVALDCAREVLGITGDKLSRIIPHHSKEATRFKPDLVYYESCGER